MRYDPVATAELVEAELVEARKALDAYAAHRQLAAARRRILPPSTGCDGEAEPGSAEGA